MLHYLTSAHVSAEYITWHDKAEEGKAMPKWTQALKHTSEYTNGMWGWYETSGNGGEYAVVSADETNGIKLAVCTLCKTSTYERANSDKYSARMDPEALANAILIASAPEAVMLLARILDAIEAWKAVGDSVPEGPIPVLADARSLLRRLVRISSEAVDDEQRQPTPTEQEIQDALRFGKQLGE